MTYPSNQGKISVPVPLKHHTETAYMVLLSIIICGSGFLASLLPSYPKGLVPWAVLFALSLIYPLLLQPTLRSNRADYEFRLMHWFPAGILLLWILLEVFGPKYKPVRILQLGFMFLWSWPLVALGIAFLMIFSVHVIRRSRVRVAFLSLLLTAFTIGAVVAEARYVNPKLQDFLFEEQSGGFAYIQDKARDLVRYITGRGQQGPVAVDKSSSSASFSSEPPALFSSTGKSQVKKPRKLTKSGPESAGFLGVTLLGLFASTVHFRAKKRI